MIKDLKRALDFIHTDAIQWDSSWPKLAREDERKHLFGYLNERFGIPEDTFKEYLLFRRKKSWQLIKDTDRLTHASILKVSKIGIRAFQRVGSYVKPTTRLVQMFGHRATRSTLEIDEKLLSKLLTGEKISIDLAIDKGYVILTLKGNGILGLGFFVNGTVSSQISRKELRQAMLIYPPSQKASFGSPQC